MAGIDCLSYIPQLVTKSESLRMLDPHVYLPSLLLGAVLSRLCGWSCYCPPVVPCTGPPLVSASVQVFVSRSPSPFRVPSAPFSRYAYDRSVVLFGGGLFCLGGSSTSRWPLRAPEVRSVSTSVAFHRVWLVPSLLASAPRASSSVLSVLDCATSHTYLMAYFLLVPSWLRVLG